MEKELIKYGFYDDMGNYCVVLDGNKIKTKFNAKKIYIDKEE